MDIFTTILENVDLMYIVSCNAATYFIITLIEGFKKNKKMRTGYKRLTSAICAALIGMVMYRCLEHPLEPIFYGWFIQFVTWDYLFKSVVKSLKRKVDKDD